MTLTVAHKGSAASMSQQVQVGAPNDVDVPDVTGDTVAQATQALAASHLTVGSTSNQVFSFVSKGDVANTTPAAHSSVPAGSARQPQYLRGDRQDRHVRAGLPPSWARLPG